MVQEREQLTLALNNPNVPENRKRIYRATIKEITRRIEGIQSAAPTVTGKASATIPANNDQIAMRSAVFNSAATGEQPQAPQPQRQAAPVTQPTVQPSPIARKAIQPIRNPVLADASTKIVGEVPQGITVEISWEDGYKVTVTEGQCRSAFVTRLKEMAASKAALDGHLQKVLRSVTFIRAVGYYSTLTNFYGEAPSLKKLGISRSSEMLDTLLEYIIISAKA
jgi:hypothetical protein